MWTDAIRGYRASGWEMVVVLVETKPMPVQLTLFLLKDTLSFLLPSLASVASPPSFLLSQRESSVFKNNNQLRQQWNVFFLIQRHPLFDILFLSLWRIISYKGGMCILHLFLLFSKRKNLTFVFITSVIWLSWWPLFTSLGTSVWLPFTCWILVHLTVSSTFTLKSSPPSASGAVQPHGCSLGSWTSLFSCLQGSSPSLVTPHCGFLSKDGPWRTVLRVTPLHHQMPTSCGFLPRLLFS